MRHHKNTHRHCKAKLEFKLYVLLYILRVLKDTFGREVNSTKECASLSPFYIRHTQIILCHLHSLPIVYSQTLSRTLSPHTHTHIHTHLLTHTHTHTHTHTSIPVTHPSTVSCTHMPTHSRTYAHISMYTNLPGSWPYLLETTKTCYIQFTHWIFTSGQVKNAMPK